MTEGESPAADRGGATLRSIRTHWRWPLSFVVMAVLVSVIGTTRNRSVRDMLVFENTVFRFMVTVTLDSWVDPSGRRFWASTWPTGSKCFAGMNVPSLGHQVGFRILRWSYRS